jgi:hypothetical protein
MSLPMFTAEASVNSSPKGYLPENESGPLTKGVVPELMCRSDDFGTTCYQCWAEGGYSGCYSFRVPHFTLH